MVGDKIRFRFRKSGDLRLLSHLDLTRCFERMLRRAELPFKSTMGFHPTPRMIFALSLPLGVAGDEEVLELELLAPFESEVVRERLNVQSPNGLEFLRASVVPMKTTAMVRRVQYMLAVPATRVDATTILIRELLDSPKVWVDRFRPRPRQVNIRKYLRGITLEPQIQSSPPNPLSEAERGDRNCSRLPLSASERGLGGEVFGDYLLTLDLWVTPQGTARADELLKALHLSDLVDAGRIVRRSLLEIHDETPADQPDAPPDLPPESAPLNHTPTEVGTEKVSAQATWGLSPNGPVVE